MSGNIYILLEFTAFIFVDTFYNTYILSSPLNIPAGLI